MSVSRIDQIRGHVAWLLAEIERDHVEIERLREALRIAAEEDLGEPSEKYLRLAAASSHKSSPE